MTCSGFNGHWAHKLCQTKYHPRSAKVFWSYVKILIKNLSHPSSYFVLFKGGNSLPFPPRLPLLFFPNLDHMTISDNLIWISPQNYSSWLAVKILCIYSPIWPSYCTKSTNKAYSCLALPCLPVLQYTLARCAVSFLVLHPAPTHFICMSLYTCRYTLMSAEDTW